MNIQEFQSKIFEEINNPENRVHLRLKKKEINREEYLREIETRGFEENLKKEEIADVLYLVDKALWGFGLIDEYINDEDVSDIRLINENNVRIKKLGQRMMTDVKFNSGREYFNFIVFITNRNNTTMSIMNAAQVFTDKDTCKTDILRFSLTSELVNTNERPSLLIRKIPKIKKDFEKLISQKYLTRQQAEYLKNRWSSGHGLLICGPNGSGKTTLANAILEETSKKKSAVVIQESEELYCNTHPEMLFRKVIPKRNGSAISYSLKDLTKLALMESFDIIVIGEIKGDEAADLSYATYTGSQAMTTVHSVSARDGHEKLIDYALDAQPNRTRGHFAKQLKTMDTIVYVEDYKIREIYELANYDRKTEDFDFIPVTLEGDGSNFVA